VAHRGTPPRDSPRSDENWRDLFRESGNMRATSKVKKMHARDVLSAAKAGSEPRASSVSSSRSSSCRSLRAAATKSEAAFMTVTAAS
jgi:hypothetical protein